VLTGAGLKIRRCILLLVNRDFVSCGEIDPAKLFIRHDVTDQVTEAVRQIESQMEDMARTLRLSNQPKAKIGTLCHNPYPCPLMDSCWGHLPEDHVTRLYRGKAKGFKLLADRIIALRDIPNDISLTASQQIQHRVAVTGQPHVNKKAIAAFLSQISFPISFLDFETLSSAIPIFDGSRPYQQIPFQFSLHVLQSPGGELKHHSFLADGTNDPRPLFMRKLLETLPSEGSVIAYNASFEIGRLKECCEFLQAHQSWVDNVKDRIVDLLLPFSGFKYYHQEQRGSASMKAVLPVLTGRGYDDLTICEGETASREFLRITFTDVTETERQHVRRALEDYCARDTEGMIWIVNGLRKLVSDETENNPT
jgi:hypothetical protein